jgi:hypothetical protein
VKSRSEQGRASLPKRIRRRGDGGRLPASSRSLAWRIGEDGATAARPRKDSNFTYIEEMGIRLSSGSDSPRRLEFSFSPLFSSKPWRFSHQPPMHRDGLALLWLLGWKRRASLGALFYRSGPATATSGSGNGSLNGVFGFLGGKHRGIGPAPP